MTTLLNPRISDPPTVLIIEDESTLRWMLSQTLISNGFNVADFASPEEFFKALSTLTVANSCLLLDMRLPGMSGLDVQAELEERKIHLPIIFMSGNSHISEAITGLKNGALDFLLKPFEEQALITVVRQVMSAKIQTSESAPFKLTPRERLVLDYVAKGWRSEQIAETLGLSVRTIKMHRSNIIHKTGAKTITEAALMVASNT
jgi:FixJ family two-component response regulator